MKKDVILALQHAITPLLEVLNAPDLLTRIKSLLRELQLSKSNLIFDDATVVIGKTKEEGSIEKYLNLAQMSNHHSCAFK